MSRDPRALSRVLSSCDAFVHANEHEPFGLVVLEAMASGLPIVGPGLRRRRELVDCEVGQVAAQSTGRGMAEAIDALFQRDLEALSRAARARASPATAGTTSSPAWARCTPA
jgi:alpha-1,6-mannosyltransferase